MWKKIKEWFGYVDERKEVLNYTPPRKRTLPSPPPKGYHRPSTYTGRPSGGSNRTTTDTTYVYTDPGPSYDSGNSGTTDSSPSSSCD